MCGRLFLPLTHPPNVSTESGLRTPEGFLQSFSQDHIQKLRLKKRKNLYEKVKKNVHKIISPASVYKPVDKITFPLKY